MRGPPNGLFGPVSVGGGSSSGGVRGVRAELGGQSVGGEPGHGDFLCFEVRTGLTQFGTRHGDIRAYMGM